MFYYEFYIINKIQRYFFTNNINFIDNLGKLISSRKYRKLYLIAILIFNVINYFIQGINIFILLSKFISILNLYFLGFLSRKLNIFIKFIFKRKRPFIESGVLTDKKTYEKKINTFSFPSNSIQTSLIFYDLLIKNLIGLNEFWTNSFLFLIVVFISLAKINRGLHYPSDILFSIIIYFCIKKIYYQYLIPLLQEILNIIFIQ